MPAKKNAAKSAKSEVVTIWNGEGAPALKREFVESLKGLKTAKERFVAATKAAAKAICGAKPTKESKTLLRKTLAAWAVSDGYKPSSASVLVSNAMAEADLSIRPGAGGAKKGKRNKEAVKKGHELLAIVRKAFPSSGDDELKAMLRAALDELASGE